MASSARSPRAQELVDAARALLDEEGSDGVSMRRVAERVGIRAPSIYKHVADKQELEAALVSDGFEELTAAFGEALEGADDRLGAVAVAYRAFGREHPHLYRLMTARPLPRDRLEPGVENAAARPLLDALDGDADAARAVWAFAHGMTILELDGRFPPDADLDAAWKRGLAAFRTT